MKCTRGNVNVIWKDSKRFMGIPMPFTHYAIIQKPGKWVKIVREKGIFSTDIEEVMMFRVDDISTFQSLTGKIFGVGNVTIESEDDSCPQLTLFNIANPYKVSDMLTDLMESERKSHNVRFSELGK